MSVSALSMQSDAPASPAQRHIANAIKNQPSGLTELFAGATELFPRWAEAAAAASSNRAEYIKREFEVLPVYLSEFFRTNDEGFLALFVGERLKACYDPSLAPEARHHLIARICEKEAQGFNECLRESLDSEPL